MKKSAHSARGNDVALPWIERVALRFVTTRRLAVLDGCTDDEVWAVLDLAAKWAPSRRTTPPWGIV